MRKNYFSRIMRYGWIIVVCTLLAVAVGLALLKIQKPVFQVSTTMYVVADAPSDNFDPTLSSNDSIGLATNYASEITSRTVMDYIYQSDPQIKQHGYGPDDLLADITTNPSSTTSTFMIIASASNTNDAVLLANDAANGFQSYIQTQRQQQLDNVRKNLQSQYAAALKQEGSIEASLLGVASNTDPHFTVYQAELTDTMHTLDGLEAQLIALPASATSNVVVIQLASTKDAAPVVKNNLIMAVTVGIGLMVGILVMLLVIFLDNRLGDEEQVREKLGMAYLGSVSKSKKLSESPALADGPVAHELADVCANLRLTGVLSGNWHSPQGAVLLVTSPRAAEGKTTIAAALAATMARGGHATVIIDGNLPQPATHLSFEGSTSSIGLSGLLKSTGNVEDTVQRTNVPGLWLLAAGAPMNASALLLEQKLPTLLAQLRKNADIIIIDGPAVLSGAEASVIASMADGVVLVIDARHDRIPLLLRAKEVLNSLIHTPVGVVMNRFPRRRHNHYYATAYAGEATPVEWIPAQTHASNGGISGSGWKTESIAPAIQQSSSFLPARTTPPPSSRLVPHLVDMTHPPVHPGTYE